VGPRLEQVRILPIRGTGTSQKKTLSVNSSHSFQEVEVKFTCSHCKIGRVYDHLGSSLVHELRILWESDIVTYTDADLFRGLYYTQNQTLPCNIQSQR
jgi:hypothetical protein